MTTPEAYSAYRQGLVGSPAFRAQEMAKCLNEQKRLTPELRQAAATLLNIPVEKFADVICERSINGIVSGRIDYEAYKKIQAKKLDAEIVKVFQGR
ncbi:hypothetical protein ACFSCV_07510 [Methylopila henanensis]|uniref:XRE family transcriptional regulator n=1 Tax=Methylopila henanensis TaxID=873516 RepID=A0ABW4K6J2_9HYPH